MTITATISKTMATAAQKYGGGTISGASALRAAALSAKLAVSLASVAVLLAVSLRAAYLSPSSTVKPLDVGWPPLLPPTGAPGENGLRGA